MKKPKPIKNPNHNLIVKSIKNRKSGISRNKPNAYISGCFMVMAASAITHLQAGEIDKSIYIVVGSFLVIPILNQLAKLVWDE